MPLTAHVLEIECQTATALALPEFTGSALRGALLGALRGRFCPDPSLDCAPCPREGTCPISGLIAPSSASGARGEEPPRPYVLRPVQAASRALAAGQPFSFGLTLIGDAVNAFPYLIQGLAAMGEAGFGLRRQAPGQFTIERIAARNPAIGADQTLYERGSALVRAPALPVSQEQLEAAAALWPGDRLVLELRSPLRLIAAGALVRELELGVVMRRLLRRLTDLSGTFGGISFGEQIPALLRAADAVTRVEQRTHWVDLESYSGRSGRRTPVGGLMGRAVYSGNLAPLLPYLGWLPIIGLGKDTTKGNGWIELGP